MKYIVFSIFSLLVSCKKITNYHEGGFSTLSIEFDHIVGKQNLILNDQVYINSYGENYTISSIHYYISNIQLTKSNGETYSVPIDDSYFIINEPENKFFLEVPVGDYSQLNFIVGVDSLKSTMDSSARTGVLDLVSPKGKEMYWNENDGYIFLKMEGSYNNDQVYQFHIGGYGGKNTSTINNIKRIELDLSKRGMPQVREGRKANIHLMVDLALIMDGIQPFQIAAHPIVSLDDFSKIIATNYMDMFRHDHTEN